MCASKRVAIFNMSHCKNLVVCKMHFAFSEKPLTKNTAVLFISLV